MPGTGLRSERPIPMISLVRCIHSAGMNAQEWSGVLECLRTHLDAQIVTLGHHAFTTGVDTPWFESPGGAAFSQEMVAFSARNPWFMSSEDYVPGRVMTGDELISHHDLKRTDFYRSFLQPHGLLHRLCGVITQRAGGAYCLSALRAEQRGAFGVREKSELEVLLGHITLALENHWRWQEADDLAHALLAMIDQDANAVILATNDAVPIYRNRAADQLLARQNGLRLMGTRIAATHCADQHLLQEAITQVAQDGTKPACGSPRVVTLACTPPTPPIHMVLRAVGRVFRCQTGIRCGLVLMTIRGNHAAHDPATCAFTRKYDLTAAQAKVSAQVFDGKTLPDIAASLHVSENTVRSHLKQIFHKTNTHGQMDLVHLHARVCPVLL
jgi:DNA-binding CsgD family transcriptional regulator